MLQSWILMKWVLKTDDDKGGQKQCQLSEAQLLSTSLDCKWMLLIMCFADMTYLLCCAVMDLWFRWKWKRKKFPLWLVCVSTSAARICDTSTLSTVTSLWWPCVVLCILFVHCTVYYLHNVHCLVHLICTVHLRAHGLQSRTGDALWIPDESQLQQKHSAQSSTARDHSTQDILFGDL